MHTLNVAVGVIKNTYGKVLISHRLKHQHQGGLWEFPGGKIELGETPFQGLQRELTEELGIVIHSAKPLLKIKHHYDDLTVLLNVFLVEQYQGQVIGMEQQKVQWASVAKLADFNFPSANRQIIETLGLDFYYPIVDESLGDGERMLAQLDALIAQGYTLIQWRAKSMADKAFKALAKQALARCATANVCLFLNTRVALARALKAPAVHLSANELFTIKEAIPADMLVAASCHNKKELEQAQKMGVLFAVLSPVLQTKTHPNCSPIGWGAFKRLVDDIFLPVFALGGLSAADREIAVQHNAQGVSGIRGFVKKTV